MLSQHAQDRAAELLALYAKSPTSCWRHSSRRRNPGAADWLLTGGGLEMFCTWPGEEDRTRALVISLWPSDSLCRSREPLRPRRRHREADAPGLRRPGLLRRAPPLGLLERDRTTDQLVAIELWQASDRLPAELLDVLPRPRSRGRVTISRSQV